MIRVELTKQLHRTRTWVALGALTVIPIIATIVTTLFSVILARATLRYVEATDKGLALAREEFEREWSPDLHIKSDPPLREEFGIHARERVHRDVRVGGHFVLHGGSGDGTPGTLDVLWLLTY